LPGRRRRHLSFTIKLRRPVLFFDYNALDPALTESKCNFWHFRFEAHADMQVNVLTDYLARQTSVHKVYLINQDYAYGQAVRRAAKEMLAVKRPDIQIVGDDLVPLGKVKDFAPYVAKIRASERTAWSQAIGETTCRCSSRQATRRG
jgi:branched-chain amino acid transport system substrate-binding protein